MSSLTATSASLRNRALVSFRGGQLFLMKVAQTLTDTQVHEDACRRIKFDEVCTQSSGTVDSGNRLGWLAVFIALLVVAR